MSGIYNYSALLCVHDFSATPRGLHARREASGGVVWSNENYYCTGQRIRNFVSWNHNPHIIFKDTEHSYPYLHASSYSCYPSMH